VKFPLRNSLVASFIVTVIYVGMKWALFDIESAMVMTASHLEDSGSSTIKFMLNISYLTLGTEREYNSMTKGYYVTFVWRHRL